MSTGPDILPKIILYQNRDLDRILERVKGTFDWNDWNVIEVHVPGLGLTLTLVGVDLVIVDADNLLIQFRTADYSSGTVGTHRYQVVVGDGSKTVPVPVGEGRLELLAAVS